MGEKPFDIVAINVGSMGAKTAAHLLKYDTVLGTLQADVSFTDDAITVDGKVFKVVTGRDPAAMPWKDMDVEVIIESTGAFHGLEGGSKHLDAGAKKVVLTAPGKNCPTYVVGVNEEDYDAANDTVVSNASCTTNGMASVCKVLDDSFEVQYGMMTTTHSYTGDQMILDGRHRPETGNQVEAGTSSSLVSTPVGKGGFVGATNGETIAVVSRCPKTGRAHVQQVRASTAMAAGSGTKTAINGFGRIGRNVLRCWLGRADKPFDIVAINVGSMGAKTAAHLLKYDTVLGTLKADVSFTDDTITVDGKVFKVVTGRDPAAMPWKDMDVE